MSVRALVGFEERLTPDPVEVVNEIDLPQISVIRVKDSEAELLVQDLRPRPNEREFRRRNR